MRCVGGAGGERAIQIATASWHRLFQADISTGAINLLGGVLTLGARPSRPLFRCFPSGRDGRAPGRLRHPPVTSIALAAKYRYDHSEYATGFHRPWRRIGELGAATR